MLPSPAKYASFLTFCAVETGCWKDAVELALERDAELVCCNGVELRGGRGGLVVGTHVFPSTSALNLSL